MSTSQPEDSMERTRRTGVLRRRYVWTVLVLVPILLVAYLPASGAPATPVWHVGVTGALVVDGPVITAPDVRTTTEDSPLFFTAAAGNAISVADAAAAAGSVQLSVTSGTVTSDRANVQAGVVVSGDGTAVLTVSGSLPLINATLDNVYVSPVPDSAADITLTIAFTDSAGQSTSRSVAITVTSFNDPPVNTVPSGIQAATEDVPRTFSTISVNDVDAGAGAIRMTLSATNGGVVTLSGTTGLAFSVGDGTADATTTFTATVADINTALNGLTVTTPTNFIGPLDLTIVSNDQGQSGAGPVGVDSDTVPISVTAVNDPPINSVPGPQSTLENTTKVFSTTAGNRISVTDVDAGTGLVQMTLTTVNGTVSLPGTGGVSFTSGDGVADPTMTFRGTLSAVNAVLDGLTVTPNPTFAGSATLVVAVNDLGNTGSGGPRTDTDTVAITVTPVNNPPTAVADAYATDQGVALAVPAPGVLGNDTDPDGDPLTAAVVTGPAHGTLTLNPNGSFTYTSASDFSGSDSFTYAASDGTASSAPVAVILTVNAVNHIPVAAGNAYTTVQQTPLAVPAPGVLGNDTDADGDALSAAVATGPAHGTVTLGANGAFTYVPATGFVGTDTFTYTARDATTASAPATVTVTVTAATCATAPPGAIVGTAANNTLTGTPGDDLIYGLGGNDTIVGLGGNDLICGGAGNDTIVGGDGNDRLFGEAGNDTVTGNAGDDTLSGGDGNDTLDGGTGANSVDAGLGRNLCRNPATGSGCP